MLSGLVLGRLPARPVLSEQAQDRLAVVVRLVLLVLIAATLASLTWRLLGSPSDPAPPAAPPLQTAAPAASGDWKLSRWHLFGEAGADAVAPRPVESLPETRLNLILRGVVVASDGGAIIEAPGGAERFYALDAELPGGATLKEVYEDRVVLERAGTRETLRLPRDRLEVGDSAVAASLPQARRARPPAAPEPATAESEISLREYRDLALRNPAELAGALQVAPRSEGGRFVGYEVQPGQDPGLMNRLGLVPGDVVTAVNGITLDSPARAVGILRSLSRGSEATVEIRRDGVSQTLSVYLDD